MASFEDHISQAKRNLSFLEQVNEQLQGYYDWQVTTCFYAALHFVNAHLATQGLQYRKHKDVKDVLNPYTLSPVKLPEDEYSAYVALQSLSRKARYLVNEKDNNLGSDKAFLTYEKHFGKALKHLNTLMCYFDSRYQLKLAGITIDCSELSYKEVSLIRKP